RVPAHDTTLLHEHDPDYFWIALGKSTVINAKPGLPDATITSADLSVHYTPGKFAHVARNPGDTPFDNITVELLEPQRSVRNSFGSHYLPLAVGEPGTRCRSSRKSPFSCRSPGTTEKRARRCLPRSHRGCDMRMTSGHCDR